jgi:hypothetical protein
MIESSSTADIMFWMIHPAIERLLSAKRLPKVTKMGKTEFSKWEDVDGSEERWVQFSVYDLNKNDSPFHPDEYTCYGHAKGDRVLPNPLPMTEVRTYAHTLCFLCGVLILCVYVCTYRFSRISPIVMAMARYRIGSIILLWTRTIPMLTTMCSITSVGTTATLLYK